MDAHFKARKHILKEEVMQKQPMGAVLAQDVLDTKKQVDAHLSRLAIGLTQENLGTVEPGELPELPKFHGLPPFPPEILGLEEDEAKIAYPEERYANACVNCGTEAHLQMVPFQNRHRMVVGWVFSCEECRPTIVTKDVYFRDTDNG